jgi:maltose/moltooligosaccharide transporter
MEKPRLGFWQVWNMSFGFLGIQFGWGLQMANMSAIYEYLGARPDQIPLLRLAAPLTGLFVQPVIGHMSDRTWGRLGRRRPYFLIGALLSSAALVLMPNSSALWMAAGLLWILDASINVSMEPFRAFVADLLPEDQRTQGFGMQSLFIGLGAVVASALPWLMTNVFGVMSTAAPGTIPLNVKLSFYIGAVAFLGAVLWTVATTREYPPDDLEGFRREQQAAGGLFGGAAEIKHAITHMPETMKRLAWVQMCTWAGLFCMWLYFPVAVARNVFGAPDERSPLYQAGVEWGGICFAMYSVVCFAFAPLLPRLARAVGRKYALLASMVGVGIAWSSILSVPYAILAGALPAGRIGVYMGIFNFFIVIPEIVASLGFGWVMSHLLGNDRLVAVMTGGLLLAVAAVLMQRVDDGRASATSGAEVAAVA